MPPPSDEYQRQHPGWDKSEAACTKAAPDPPPSFRIVNPADLQFIVPPEREWIVPDWLPVGHATALYGDGGVGKSLLAQQLQTACATGTPWCGLAVAQCPSLGLYCEDDEAELHRRQDKIVAAADVHYPALAPMRWISGIGLDCTLASFGPDGRMHAMPFYDAIEAAALDHAARLIILDTAADLFGGNENDRHQVRLFIGLLNRLAQTIGGAVLLNAHPSRTGLASGNLDGGSTAWSNTVRSRWSLARPDDEDAGPDTPERVLTRRKANYAATGAALRLRWTQGALVPLDAPDRTPGLINRAAVAAHFLALLARCAAAGIRVSDSRNAGNYAPRIFARRPDADGWKLPDFARAMADLFAAGAIRNEAYGRPGDARQRIVPSPQPGTPA